MKIYVACLAAYNNGILHGEWIDASSDVEELQEGVDKVLKSSPMPDAEEYAIHDYDEFPNLGEYPGLEGIARTTEVIEGSDLSEDATRAVIDYADDLDQAESILSDNHGVWDSFQDYADEWADEQMACYQGKENDWLKRYFDYEKHANEIEGDYTVIDLPKGVLVTLA